MEPLAGLDSVARADLAGRVAGDPLMAFYLALRGRAPEAAALGARFDGLTVVSTLGPLDARERAALLALPGPLELHVPEAEAPCFVAAAGGRLRAARPMLALAAPTGGAACDAGAETPDAAGWEEARALMAALNPGSLLSAHMATMPFAVIREGEQVLAMAGTIAVAEGTALLGHFLTRPEARGRGLARRLARHLRARHGAAGATRALLATTVDNAPALRAYAAAGFTAFARRVQIDLAPADASLTAPPPRPLPQSPAAASR
jgi:ribosomal protein S18 acetylase RimI-like enzyme